MGEAALKLVADVGAGGRDYPLVVDLDGTLLSTDMLHESVCKLLSESPASLGLIPWWLCRGKAALKRHLAKRAAVDPGALPFNHDFLTWLRAQRQAGRPLVLCTASDDTVARSIADHLDLFDDVMASDGATNLAGRRKAELLVRRFGSRGFDYAGNSWDDLPVWKRARRAVLVTPSPDVAILAKRCSEVERVFPKTAPGLSAWVKVLRLHQWLKNLLLAVPLIAAHHVTSAAAWTALLLAFVSFGFCASAVYVTNDLLDLQSDRRHPRKGARPFASGLVPVWVGFALVPVLLMASGVIALQLDHNFLTWLLVYGALTCAYSFGLKRRLLVDCLTLAMLYTMRIVAGAAVTGIALSFWLLAFSCFLFLSLAFAKRYAELRLLSDIGRQHAQGRAYCVSDAPVIQMLGITSGYAAVIVMALYLHSDSVRLLYRSPPLLWGAIPIMVFWISWIWMQAHRGQLHEDAVIFAVTDRTSLLAGLALACVLTAGALSVPW